MRGGARTQFRFERGLRPRPRQGEDSEGAVWAPSDETLQLVLHRNACYSFMWGSSQSRRELPMRLMTSVVTKMASPGKVAIHHELSM